MDHVSQGDNTAKTSASNKTKWTYENYEGLFSTQEITNRLERIPYQLSQHPDLLPQGIANLPHYFSSLWGRNLRKEWNFGVKVDVRMYHTVRCAPQENKLQLRH